MPTLLRLLAIAVVVTGCGSTATPSTTENTVRAPGSRGPVPTIELSVDTSKFTTHHLPAVAASGELAVVAVRDTDGGRGYPNLALQVRDRTDRVVETINVLAASDYEQLAPNGKAGPVLEQRIRDANNRLIELHARHDLVTVEPLVVTDATAQLPHLASGQGLTIELLPARLLVRKDSQQLVAADASRWRVPAGKRCATCDPCENPEYLAMAYKAANINVVVVEIGYRGTDMCWEPGHQLHVVAW